MNFISRFKIPARVSVAIKNIVCIYTRIRVTHFGSFLRFNGIILLILIMGTYYRFEGLADRDIWYDEALTVKQANKSLAQITKEVPTPIHYYVVHYFLMLGKNTFTLGLPSAILGILSIYIIYLAGTRIKNKTLGLLAALMLSISPMHIEFSQQILFFSYFGFFSVMILYFLSRLLERWMKGHFSYFDLFFVFILSALNIFTQMVSLVLAGTTVLIMLAYFFSRPKTIWKYRYMIPIVISGVIVVFVLLQSVGNGGYSKFLDGVRFNTLTPIPLGWSLSHKIGDTLHFNLKFFYAMAEWFGLGGGKMLNFYLLLFAGGILNLVFSRKTRYYVPLILGWIFLPFVFLYLFRITHWFEEKYFIFILPMYLLVVASGVQLIISRFISLPNEPRKQLAIKVAGVVLVIGIILIVAQKPIKSRVSYGFPVEDINKNTEYNWRRVYNYLLGKTKPGEKVIVPRDATHFLEFYMPKGSIGTTLFDEIFLSHITTNEYAKMVEEGFSYFYICPEDYSNYYPYDATVAKKPKGVGHYGIYKISFVKNSPLKLSLRPDSQLYYYDDYRTGKYLADAERWENLADSYWGSKFSPFLEYTGVLAPIEKKESYIDYRFKIPADLQELRLVPQFEIGSNALFEVLIGESEKDIGSSYSRVWSSPGYYKPQIVINTLDQDLYIRLRFSYTGRTGNTDNSTFLKSFGVFPTSNTGVLLEDGPEEIRYSAALVIVEDGKWEADSIENLGWWQDHFGYLLKHQGKPDENPLIYRFNLKRQVSQASLKIKTIETISDFLNIHYREDLGDWHTLKEGNTNLNPEYDFELKLNGPETLDLRFQTSSIGEATKLRDFRIFIN